MSELRKILVASLDVIPDATGASTRLTEILRGLTPVFQVDALTSKTEAHSHIERYYGARLMRVPMLRRELPSRAQTFERAVRRQLESEEYELIHVTDPFGGYPVCQRRGQAGHRVIYDAHSLMSLDVQLTHPEVGTELRFMNRLRRIERHCLLTADLVLAGSHAFKGQLEQLGVPAERIRLVPPPVDLTHFRETPFPPDAPLRLVYLGGCAAWEGIETVLKALRLLLDLGLAVRLSIAGDLHESAKRLLRSSSGALRLGETVELLGPIAHEQLSDVLEQAHVCLAPFAPPAAVGAIGLGSLKFVEYLAAGRPIVAADSPLHRELAGAPPAAVFFRPGDAGELAGKLQQLAKDPTQRTQLAERAHSRARNAFDASLARRAVLRAYYDLIDPSVVVNADAYAPDRSGAAEGDAPTSTQAATFEGTVPEPETNPAAGESTTNVSRVGPPVRDEHTPTANAPATSVVPSLAAERTSPAGLPDPTTDPGAAGLPGPPAPPEADEPDWFSEHLPPRPGSTG